MTSNSDANMTKAVIWKRPDAQTGNACRSNGRENHLGLHRFFKM